MQAFMKGQKGNEEKKKGQLSIEDFLKKLAEKKNLSSTDVVEAIAELTKYHGKKKKEEKEEKKKAQEESIKKEKDAEKERIDSITSMDLPLDYENAFFGDKRAEGVKVESIADGLVASLNYLGRVDIEYIAEVSGSSMKDVILELKGSIYQNPEKWEECFYKGWETADEYLAGNLVEKWRKAKDASRQYNGYFDDNIRAIEEILPPAVATKDIYVTLGSPWIPTDIIDDFIDYLFGRTFFSGRVPYAVKHDEITGTWDIPEKTRYYNNAKVYNAYGTRKMPALYILEKTLNMRSVAVTEEVSCTTNKSGTRRVVNQSETVAVLEKQKKLIDAFKSWVWRDSRRADRLRAIYEAKYSCYRTRRYDGRFLQFPNMNKGISLRPHQKNAIARIIFSKGTLLAHDVGSGKTYVMIAAGMELKRMGLSNKNLYVVPNNLVGQWQKMFTELYPTSKILVIAPKDFTPLKRQLVLEKIRDNDYDGIVMAASCFDMIPLSKEYYRDKYKEKQQRLDELSKQVRKNTTGIRSERKKIEEEMLKVSKEILLGGLDGVTFDELGITRLFVDEAHAYKNLPVQTKTTNVLGIASAGSKKCVEMLDKVRHVQKTDGGVVFATGTPITNSITDAFVMQYYLQYGELELLDLQNFDSWIGMFAETQSEFEIDVDTSKFRLATRFSKFHNLPELTSILSSIADFHSTDASDDLPELDGYTDATIGKTIDFTDYLKKISQRADAVRSRAVSAKDDNMLKITTDGRKAALDLRLVDLFAHFSYSSKVSRCADNVADLYYKTMFGKCSQLIFCDTSTPKIGFNMYDELRRVLTLMGVPNDQIAYVHDATTEKKREKLFDDVRKGNIRVLIGSTQKLGLGVNVQERLVAIHHLDVPWRPADMVQREGRIIREGNINKKIQIFRYITEGSFDAYSWQLLESKQRFIAAILSGSMKERSGSDISDTVLNYAEVKALAIGNPLIKKRVELANELSRLYSLQRKYVEARSLLEQELEDIPARIVEEKERVDKCRDDVEFFSNLTEEKEMEKEEKYALRKTIFDAVMENVMQEEERVLLTYKGFEIVLPKDMPKEKPFIYLQRTGRYFVEIGEVEKGVLTRIDNCLIGLKDRLVRLDNAYNQLCGNKKSIEEELAKDENYEDKIISVQTQLDKIDKELGVKKDE